MTSPTLPTIATTPPLDGRAIVDDVVEHLEICDWTYRRDPAIRHLVRWPT